MAGIAKSPVFLILEGGGAKGIAHLGALRAVEELKYPIAGIAGASADAFVAALAAAGYQSQELLDDSSKYANPLNRRNLDPVSLLGMDSWTQMHRSLKAARRLALEAGCAGFLGAAVASPRGMRVVWRLLGKCLICFAAPTGPPIRTRLRPRPRQRRVYVQ